jgi:two-component system response regulator HydG
MSMSVTPHARILVVDDDAEEMKQCSDALGALTKIPITAERKSTNAAKMLGADRFDLVITDLRMPLVDGIELLRIAQSHDPELPVVILTGHPSVDTAVESLKRGAADYLTKPVNTDELVLTAQRLLSERQLRGEHRLLQRQIDRPYAFDEIVGTSAPMQKIFDTIYQLAEADVDVLIVGETGTGKELVARSIHKHSHKRQGRFVPVDCGAIPENLLENEFFGHERGAFSGANTRSIGLMEFADSGTFFLDEINALPLSLQAKLLRALQERQFRRVGATREISVDLRVVAAGAHDPAELIKVQRFREDLYYRLNVGRIELPPLRERADDIPLLATHFVERYAREMGKPAACVSPDAIEVLTAYSWPGNVRELQNVLKRTIAMTRREVLMPDDLPDEIVTKAGKHEGAARATFFQLRAERMAEFEKDYLTGLLQSFGGDVASAAQSTDLPKGTLYRLMKKHNLAASQFRSDP